ncbi:MAG: TldD/PmbA family protein [Candidatus Latescibacterota bacterium]|nr:MAG: TldD/PmbA family protein [Candidatus Latescibacterota bacterium]
MTAEQIVEQAKDMAQAAEASISYGESMPISFESGRLKSIKTNQSTNVGLRVIVDGKLGESHSTSVEDAEGLVRRAVEAAQFGKSVSFRFPGPQNVQEVQTHDESVAPVTQAEMVAIGQEMVDGLRRYDPDIVSHASVGKFVGRSEFANSSGLSFFGEDTHFSVSLYGNRIRGTDILWAGDGFGWRKRAVVDHLAILNKTIQKFRWADRMAKIRSGKLPVIFTPNGISVLLLALREGFNGKNVLLGSSPLAGKIGEQVFDEGFSLTDDGTVDYASSSGRYDEEGMPHRRLPMVENGIVRNFLYDLDTASKSGTESTGHGVGCGPTNLLVGEGAASFEEMIRSVDEGMIVEDVMGLGQGNVISGAFSVNVSLGYKIEKGEIVGRVKDVMLAGNSYEALNRVAAVGDKAEWGSGSRKTPPVLIEELSVVAK